MAFPNGTLRGTAGGASPSISLTLPQSDPHLHFYLVSAHCSDAATGVSNKEVTINDGSDILDSYVIAPTADSSGTIQLNLACAKGADVTITGANFGGTGHLTVTYYVASN